MRPYFGRSPENRPRCSLLAVCGLSPAAAGADDGNELKDASFVAFPITDWTLNWYAQVLQDKQFIEASLYSVGGSAGGPPRGDRHRRVDRSSGLDRGHLGQGHSSSHSPACRRSSRASSTQSPCGYSSAPSTSRPARRRSSCRMQSMPLPFVVIMVLTRLRSMPANLVDAARDLARSVRGLPQSHDPVPDAALSAA